MTDPQYVVVVEASGFDDEGEKLKLVKQAAKPTKLVDSLVRDDSTGLLYFEFDPPSDGEGDTGAKTWDMAKDYVWDGPRGAVNGAGLRPDRVYLALHEVPSKKESKVSSHARDESRASTKAASAARPSSHRR